jgi:hypothetical protein
VAGWLNCFINGCWILVVACMVLASRRAPKGALIGSLSFSHDPSRRLIKGSLFFCQILCAILIAHNRCIKCNKERNGASPFNEGRRKMTHLMWTGPQMAINSRVFHLLKHQSLRAREERLEKRERVFSRREYKKYKCSIFLRVSKNTESVIFL